MKCSSSQTILFQGAWKALQMVVMNKPMWDSLNYKNHMLIVTDFDMLSSCCHHQLIFYSAIMLKWFYLNINLLWKIRQKFYSPVTKLQPWKWWNRGTSIGKKNNKMFTFIFIVIKINIWSKWREHMYCNSFLQVFQYVYELDGVRAFINRMV